MIFKVIKPHNNVRMYLNKIINIKSYTKNTILNIAGPITNPNLVEHTKFFFETHDNKLLNQPM